MDNDDAVQAGSSAAKKPRINWIISDEDIAKFLFLSDNELSDSDNDDSDLEDGHTSTGSSSEEDVVSSISSRNSGSTNGDILWHRDASVMQQLRFSNKNRRLLVPVPGSNTPIDYFNLLVDDSFWDLIATETNKHAAQLLLCTDLNEQSEMLKWKDVTVPELRIFFGLVLHMGTIKISRIHDYWKKERLFNIPCFSKYMSRGRFFKIMRCLNFSCNPKSNDSKPTDGLYKVKPLINYFNNKISEIYYPGRELSLDESMVLWNGQLVYRHHIKNKSHKHCVKLYMLTEPNGLVVKFLVHIGVLDDLGANSHTTNTVMRLMQDKLNNGHSLYMDDYYNSYNLAKRLLDNNTYCTGTLRSGQRNLPPEVNTMHLKKGESVCRYSDGIMIGKWKDKDDVFYISTEFKNNMVCVANKKGQTEKPVPVVMYSMYMGGNDRQDQMTSYYPCSRKSLGWHKKVGIHILQMLLLNSFFLYNMHCMGSKKSFYDYRLDVIKDLLPKPAADRSALVTMYNGGQHLPAKCKTALNGKTMRKKCRVCASTGKRKDTIYKCEACPQSPGLCLNPCFKLYHKNV